MAKEKSNSEKESIKRINLRLPESIYNELLGLSKIKNMTDNQYMIYALKKSMNLVDDDRDLWIYRIADLEKKLMKIDNKLDEMGQLFIDFLIFYFRTDVPLPSDPKLAATEINKATERTIKFLEIHRNKIRKGQKPFMEQIFGSMLEQDDTFDSYHLMDKKHQEEGPEKARR